MRSAGHASRTVFTILTAGLLIGCASIGAPIPPSLELPKPPTDLHAQRKGDKVHLFWTVPARTTDRQSVRRRGPTLICRSPEAMLSQCAAAVGQLPPGPEQKQHGDKQTATYVDMLPRELQQQNPMGMITYALEALNDSGRGAGLSNQVQVPLAPTLPPPADFAAQVTAQGVLITWTCAPPSAGKSLEYRLRIFRRLKTNTNPSQIAELSYSECAERRESQATAAGESYKPEFYDQTFEWEKDYVYSAAVVTVIPKGDQPATLVEGDDTPDVEVFTRDIYPPGVPTGLQAVFSGPGQPPFIDLLWAPDTDRDLAGYNVYRREGGRMVKINSDVVKTPAFRDTSVTSGKTYTYSVSAVDLRGNESAKSEEASEQVP
jgi:hypothetical protein